MRAKDIVVIWQEKIFKAKFLHIAFFLFLFLFFWGAGRSGIVRAPSVREYIYIARYAPRISENRLDGAAGKLRCMLHLLFYSWLTRHTHARSVNGRHKRQAHVPLGPGLAYIAITIERR